MGRRAWGKVVHLPWSPNPSVPTLLLKFAPHRGTPLFWPSVILQHDGFRIISTPYGSLLKGDNHHPLYLEIIEGLVWKGTSKDHLVQPPCLSRFTYSRLHRIMSGWAFECLQSRRLHSLSGDTTHPLCVSVLCHPQSKLFSYSSGMSCVSVCACHPLSCC